jgi:hypothetical protein
VTIDDRIEKLEHITAGWIEQSPRDYEENRRLWREQKAETDAEIRETGRLLRESGKQTDERIDKLVMAIGELVRRLDDQRSSPPRD